MRRRLLLLAFLATGLFAQRPDFEVRVIEDSSGNPLPSAEARLQKAGVHELAADLDTDREGIARAAVLAPGDYTLTVAKPNYVGAQLTVRIPSQRITVRLVHFGIISGLVTDAKGRPVPSRISAPYGRTIGGAQIRILTKSDGAGGLASFREVEIGDDGHYRVYDLPPGQYAVGLWYDGLPDGSGMMLYPDSAHPRWFTVGGGEENNGVDFQVMPRPAVSVRGRVVLPKPKTMFSVALGAPEQPLAPIALTLTEEDGSFRFARVSPGTYDVFAFSTDGGYGARNSSLAPNPLYGRTRFNVGAASVSGIELTVASGRSVAVTLRPDKAPEGCPPSLAIRGRPVEPWGILPSGDSQILTFGKETVMADLAPGRVQFEPTNPPATCYTASLPVADMSGDKPAPVAIEFAPAGSLRGTLRGPYTVVLLESDATSTSEARVAMPDAEGRFAFEGLKPGKYRIAARPEGRWVSDPSRMIEIEIPGGSPTEIELPPPPKGDRP